MRTLFAAVLLVLLLLPVTASAQDRVYALSEWAVLTGHALDAAATQNCIGAGRCRELNPWLARYDSPVRFTAAKFVVGGGQLWAMRKLRAAGHPRWALVANFAIGSAFTAIAIRNQKVGK